MELGVSMEDALRDECALLLREDVRAEIGRLRRADSDKLRALNAESACKRVKWFRENRDSFDFLTDDLLLSGYKLLCRRFGIAEEEAPVVRKTDRELVFHSMNFCPTLEACRILGYDTRTVCRMLNENSTDTLLKALNSRLKFSRNYEMLRPYSPYREEMIRLEDDA
jgi:tRNA(adenine34) deaminase